MTNSQKPSLLVIPLVFVLAFYSHTLNGNEAAPVTAASTATPTSKIDKKTFSINFENTELRAALSLIALQAGLRLDMPNEMGGTVNYSFANVTLEAALKQISRENEIAYKILPSGVLRITPGFSNGAGGGGRSPANVDGTEASGAKHIQLKYLTTSSAVQIVSGLISKDDKIIPDPPSNSLIYLGSDRNYAVVREAIEMFDVMPQQILIEAHIVELNRNKSREFGFSFGDLSDPTLANVGKSSAIVKNPQPSNANFAAQLGMGRIDGALLSARLAAAEVEGAARILSRPKVVTINNKAAEITSGISYSIRTLTTVDAGATDESDNTMTSGVTQVTAGLNLSVTPTIVGVDKVKLLIRVTNSEPDESTKIDGIPGIVSNSTTTEIIVANGKTASVAGLVKNTFSEAETGVPFLSKVPILGWLFSSHSKSDRDKELMVFITPQIVDRNLQQMETNLSKVESAFPEVYAKTKPKAELEGKPETRPETRPEMKPEVERSIASPQAEGPQPEIPNSESLKGEGPKP